MSCLNKLVPLFLSRTDVAAIRMLEDAAAAHNGGARFPFGPRCHYFQTDQLEPLNVPEMPLQESLYTVHPTCQIVPGYHDKQVHFALPEGWAVPPGWG